MASKRNLRRKACGGKQRFPTQAEAGAVAHRIASRNPARGALWAYRCDFCSGFHFGHPPARVRQAASARAAARPRMLVAT